MIDASGSAAAVATGLKSASNRGRMVIVGCPRGLSSFDLYAKRQKKEIRLCGSCQPFCPEIAPRATPWTQRCHRELMLEYLATGRMELASIITHIAKLADWQKLYDTLANQKDKSICGLFEWS